MLRLVVGKELFLKGKELYFSRYRNGNANSDQFFACFEEVSGRSLDLFKQTWLHAIGYPAVSARTEYNAGAKRFTVHFRQHPQGGGVFHLPVSLALVDNQGSVGTRNGTGVRACRVIQ